MTRRMWGRDESERGGGQEGVRRANKLMNMDMTAPRWVVPQSNLLLPE